jgi:hypothetical protein
MMQRYVVIVACALCAACNGTHAAPKPAPAPPPSAAAPVAVAPQPAADPTRLPEDPVLGKRSEEQWREHMAHEEEERQMLFDKPRLRLHRALVKQLIATRARVDHATTPAGLAKLRAAMPKTLEALQKRVTEIDHWGVNSRLLPDYAALQAALGDSYLDAKLAALNGDGTALSTAGAEFERRLERIDHWLEECEEGGEEEE